MASDLRATIALTYTTVPYSTTTFDCWALVMDSTATTGASTGAVALGGSGSANADVSPVYALTANAVIGSLFPLTVNGSTGSAVTSSETRSWVDWLISTCQG